MGGRGGGGGGGGGPKLLGMNSQPLECSKPPLRQPTSRPCMRLPMFGSLEMGQN